MLLSRTQRCRRRVNGEQKKKPPLEKLAPPLLPVLLLLALALPGTTGTSYVEVSSGTCNDYFGALDTSLYLTNEADCDAAATALGLEYLGTKCRISDAYPPGCYVVRHDGINAGEVYLNTCEGGRYCTDTRHCVCKESMPPTPGPTPKPSSRPTPRPTLHISSTEKPSNRPTTYAEKAYYALSESTCEDSGLIALGEDDCREAADFEGYKFDKAKCRKNSKVSP